MKNGNYSPEKPKQQIADRSEKLSASCWLTLTFHSIPEVFYNFFSNVVSFLTSSKQHQHKVRRVFSPSSLLLLAVKSSLETKTRLEQVFIAAPPKTLENNAIDEKRFLTLNEAKRQRAGMSVNSKANENTRNNATFYVWRSSRCYMRFRVYR